jgi:hypothetical protein
MVDMIEETARHAGDLDLLDARTLARTLTKTTR